MPISYTGKLIEVSRVIVPPNRQRKQIDGIEELAQSIKARGLLNPIILDENFELQAGERRLLAHKHLGYELIPYNLASDLTPIERQLLELEENVQRVDLTWQERVDATARIHTLYMEIHPEWSPDKTASALNINVAHLHKSIALDKRIKSGDKAVAGATKMSEALTVISRSNKRALEDLTNALIAPPPPTSTPRKSSILNASFLEWAKTPQDRFDFIHCDFPYGVNLQGSGQVSSAFEKYEDQENIYWELLDCFAENINNFAKPVCHVMFWFSMNFYEETIRILQNAGLTVQPFPLIWLKSDQKGIAPDHMRQPRRIYETALIASRGDRLSRKLINNAIAAPTESSRFHVSTKPKEVLKHFFQMFVEEGTSVLDPTCGSGNAIAVAKGISSSSHLGIEINEEYVKQIEGIL